MGGTTEKGASVGTGHTRPHMTETPLNRLAVLGVLAGIGTGLLVAALNRAIVTTERLVYGVDHLKALDPVAGDTAAVSHHTCCRWDYYLMVVVSAQPVWTTRRLCARNHERYSHAPVGNPLQRVPPSHLRCGRGTRWT